MSNNANLNNKLTDRERSFRLKAGLFLASVGGCAALFGFSRTLTSSRKYDQKLFEKGCTESGALIEAGTSLALRALGWGTFYAFLGTGVFCYGVWKLSGAQNVMNEFRLKMGQSLPKLSKDGPATSRTEFEGLNDLLTYVSEWKEKKET